MKLTCLKCGKFFDSTRSLGSHKTWCGNSTRVGHWKGKKRSLKTRKKISISLTGRSSPKKGKHLSQVTKDKLSLANTGKKLSRKTRKKISLILTGRKKSAKTRKKLSVALSKYCAKAKAAGKDFGFFRGKKHSVKSRRRMSISKKGKPSPRKGCHLSKKTKKLISISLQGVGKGRVVSKKTRRKLSIANTGKKRSLAAKKRISVGHKGQGLGRKLSKRTRLRISCTRRRKGFVGLYGDKLPLIRKKQARTMKKRWANPSFAQMMLKAQDVKPNKKEKLLYALLKEVRPKEFALNVKANVMTLGGRIPDFVNINGKKQVIELFGDYWHGKKRTGKSKEIAEKEKKDHYAKLGFDCLIIWEYELKDLGAVKNKILNFSRQVF